MRGANTGVSPPQRSPPYVMYIYHILDNDLASRIRIIFRPTLTSDATYNLDFPRQLF